MVQLYLSTEDKLLLYCSRLSINGDVRYKIIEILSNPLDWNYIVECSMKQGITPLFYWNLKKISNGNDVPSEVMKNLEKMYYSNLARNMLLYDELNKILKVFNKAGIDVIVLKGAFLAEEIYKNIGLRPMGDIDLLVKEKDLQKANVELTKLKYAVATIFLTKSHEQFQTVLNNELAFIQQNKKIFIEIHWDIQPHHSNFKVDIDNLWENAKPIKIADTETLTLASEDMLQHLCLHLDKHINGGSPKPLRDYCDIAEVIRYYKETINWDYLLQNSKDYGIEEPIFQNLSIANKYFEVFIPENILSELEPVKYKASFEEIFKGTFKGNSSENRWNIINYLMNSEKVKGNWMKAQILFGYFFPSKDYMMYRYSTQNKNQVYICYLIRSSTAFRLGLSSLKQLPHYVLRSTLKRNL